MTEHADCTCCFPHRPITRLVVPGETHEWSHDDEGDYAIVDHVHVVRSMRDCDGPRSQTYVRHPADYPDDEDFWHNVAIGEVPLWRSAYGTTIEITANMLSWGRSTEEGHDGGVLDWCDNPDCAHDNPTQRDRFAEAAGY